MEKIPEDPELRRSWNRLALAMERPEVFYTYEWAIAVQRAYGDSMAPFVLCAYEGQEENQELVGLVALAWKKTGTGGAVFLTADTADYCDFLSPASRRDEFVEAVFSELKARRIEKIVLTNLPADSCSVPVVSRVASSHRYHLHLRPAYLCARVVLGSADERAAVKQSVTAKKRLRRNMRELEKRGPVRVQHDTSWDQIEPVLPAFRRAHVARFLETGRISNLIRDERRVFLHELARELSGSGWATVSRLFVREVAAAWNYGFRFAGSWFWYQPTANSAFGDFSPGYCLLAKIVELACDSPDVDIVDLGLGAEAYKDRFATANRQTLFCELNTSISSHARTVVRNCAAEAARASPRVESAIRVMISHIANLRERIRSVGLWGLSLWLVRRVWRSLFAFDDVFFFEWPASGRSSCGLSTALRRLDSDLVGAAAIEHGNDSAALRYLVRSAQRLQSGVSEGFALLNAAGVPVHMCWVKDFEGFEMAELGCILHAPCKDAVMIFDCFTPASDRGHGFFSLAIAALADQLRSQGKVPWIFGAATNQDSVHGIEKSGFTYRFSLGRRKIFFFNKTKELMPSSHPVSAANSVTTP